MTTTAEVSTKPAGKSILGILWSLFIFILICGLGAGGYYLWMQQQAIKGDIAGRVAELERQSSSLSGSISGMNEQMSSIALVSGELKKSSESAIAAMQASLASQANEIALLSTTDRQDWLLAEAQYLLSLANQRVVIERETDTALALLQTADRILQGIGDVNLSSVRRQIKSELIALQLAGELDREGVYLSLVALADQVDALALNQIGQAVEAKKEVPEIDLNLGLYHTIKANLSGLSEELWDHIKTPDLRVNPILPPDQHFYVRQNIRFMLEQAQLALLREKQELYARSLKKSRTWLERYYAMSELQETVILGELDRLIEKNIVQSVPDISGSRSQLETYISRHHKIKAVDPSQDSAVDVDAVDMSSLTVPVSTKLAKEV